MFRTIFLEAWSVFIILLLFICLLDLWLHIIIIYVALEFFFTLYLPLQFLDALEDLRIEVDAGVVAWLLSAMSVDADGIVSIVNAD